MSCRHAAANNSVTTISAERAETAERFFSASPAPSALYVVNGSIRNGRHLSRVQRLEEPARPLEIKFRIRRLDTDEEPVAAREREAWHVEHRVVRLRQPVERQHSEHRRQRGGENRALEGDRDE